MEAEGKKSEKKKNTLNKPPLLSGSVALWMEDSDNKSYSESGWAELELDPLQTHFEVF